MISSERPPRLHVDRFNAELLLPAHERYEELRAEVAEAERALEGRIRAWEFDADATAEAQRRLDELNIALTHARRRYHWLQSCENSRDAGGYMTLEGLTA